MNDGGPAFPADRDEMKSDGTGTYTASYPGMFLRDYFAAMPLSEEELSVLRLMYSAVHPDEHYSLHQLRYFRADQMLKARA